MVRAPTTNELAERKPRVMCCFEAGALATGASLHVHDVAPDYSHMEHDDPLVELYAEASHTLGRTYGHGDITFSTDMGNVSLAMPSIHPTIAIDTAGAVNHQPEFAAACVNESADRAVLEGALGMAWTVIEAATRDAARARLLSHSAS